MLDKLGFRVTALGLGFRGGAYAAAEFSGGIGVDGMLVFDVATLTFGGKVIGWADIGFGIGGGAGGVVLVGFRISPKGESGAPGESLPGPAINFSLAALAKVGFSVSPLLFQGKEGWVLYAIGGGAQVGAKLSLSYGLAIKKIIEAISILLKEGVQY